MCIVGNVNYHTTFILYFTDASDILQLQTSTTFSADDNVQSGDVACVTLSIVEDDVLEPIVVFLTLFETSPLVTVPLDSPDFTRVFVIDTTAQGSSIQSCS